MNMPIAHFFVLALTLIIAACQPVNKAERPKPQLPTTEAIGHFCNMLLDEHEGPKSQVLRKGDKEPLWFTTVRDGIAYTRLPEESLDVAAVYVTAIDTTPSFSLAHPETMMESWISAEWAVYVIGSRLRGGMGAMEAFPFRDVKMATQFTKIYGGRVIRFSEIPEDYVLGNSETMPAAPDQHKQDARIHGHQGAMRPQEPN